MQQQQQSPRSTSRQIPMSRVLKTAACGKNSLNVPSFSRTSTCCTLSTYSSSSSDLSQYEEDDEVDNEVTNAAVEATSFFALRRNSSPQAYTYIAQPSPTPKAFGTYILYLVPSGKRAHALNVTRDYVGSLLGFDESYLYPLHCTLTSFFNVASPDGTATKQDIAANLATSLVSHLQKRYGVVCTATAADPLSDFARPGSGQTQIVSSIMGMPCGQRRSVTIKHRRVSTESSTTASHHPQFSKNRHRFHQISAGRHRAAHSSKSRASSPVQWVSHSKSRGEMCTSVSSTAQRPMSKSILVSHSRNKLRLKARRSLGKIFRHSQTTHNPRQEEKKETSSQVKGSASTDHMTCSSCLFEIRHEPARRGNGIGGGDNGDDRSSRLGLKNVFVTQDESLILPIQLKWTKQEQSLGDRMSQDDPESGNTSFHLRELCSYLQEALLPRCEVSMPRRPGSKITAKAASHVALSSSKRRNCSLSSVLAAARIYDSASVFESRADFWDLALCELESWGSLDESEVAVPGSPSAKSTEGSRLLTPHVFREILRISRVGVTVH